MIRAAAVLTAALVLVPSASAWRQLSTQPVSNHADPAVLVKPDGSELVAYAAERSGSVIVGANTLASGWAIVGDPRLLRQPDGTLLLYVSGPQGIVHFTSSDGGASWSGPSAAIPGSRVGDVQGGTVLPDGTAILSQDGTGFIQTYKADRDAGNIFPRCCGYAETLTVDSTGHTWIAFWSNASNGGYLAGPVGGPYVNLSGGAQTVSRDDRVPLVADGNRLVTAWVEGYPTPQFLHVTSVDGGKGPTFRMTGIDLPHVALAVDPATRLWAVWTSGGAVHAARSRHQGRSFGAQVSLKLPSGRTAYVLEAGALPNGQVDAVANLGDSIWTQRLLPGLTVRLFAKVVAFPPGHHSVVQFAQALDDGIPVPSARFNGRKGNAKATIALTGFRRHVLVRVTAAGYAGASFRMP